MIDTSFIKLKKLAKETNFENAKAKAVLMGDCATQHLATAIRGVSAMKNYPIEVVDIDYNLIDAQILDPTSELYTEKPKFTIIVQCTEKLEAAFCECKERAKFAEQMYEKIENNWKRINNQIHFYLL